MRKILIIGIGAGNPDYVTIQAVNALNQADVFFIPDKGSEKAALQKLRTDICERFITERTYRFVSVKTPEREKVFSDYKANVAAWHEAIEENYISLLTRELPDGKCGAFLTWGDPTLYDSTLRIIEKIRSRAVFEFEYEIIPGITAAQALAARHHIALNSIGEPVHITTGRKLAEGFPGNVDSVVVFLDGDQAFNHLDTEDLDIYWGAYIGTPEEVLVAGRLSEVKHEIAAIREQRRQENGWIMDTYLLRRPEK